MKIGDVFKPANGGEQYARIVAFPERNVSTVTGKPLAKPVQDIGYKLRKNNRGRWSTKVYQLPKRSFKMEFTALALLLALLPGIAFAQYLGHSQRNIHGGWDYYSAPSAGYDNAMATQNFINAMRMLQQQRQFNRRMELMQQELDRRDRELQRSYQYRPQSIGISKPAPAGIHAVWSDGEHYETPEGRIEELPPETMPRWQQAAPVKIVETGYPSHLIAE